MNFSLNPTANFEFRTGFCDNRIGANEALAYGVRPRGKTRGVEIALTTDTKRRLTVTQAFGAVTKRGQSGLGANPMFAFLKRWFWRRGADDGSLTLIEKCRRGHIRAIETLVTIKTQGMVFPWIGEAVDALIEAARIDKTDVQLVALEALPFFGEAAKKSIPLLAQQVQNAEPRVAAAALFTMCALGVPDEHRSKVVDRLVAYIKQRDAENYLHAISSIQRFGEDAASVIPDLEAALLSGDPDLATAAASTLGNIGARAASSAPTLIALLDDDDELASEAFTALNCMGEPAVPALVSALAQVNTYTRIKIINCLGFIGPPAKAALPVLAKLENKGDSELQHAIRQAQQRIGGTS